MDKDSRIIAITRILPQLQAFLGDVLAEEALSVDAERQRLEIIKELEQLTKPPVLPPRPANLKTQAIRTTSVPNPQEAISLEELSDENTNDFASVQRKLSNIFFLRRDFEEINNENNLVNGHHNIEDGGKNISRINKLPTKHTKKKQLGGIYEDLPDKGEIEEFEVLLEDEGHRANRSLTLARGTNFRASLGKAKWFARKEKPIAHDVFVSDLQLPTISGHLMEVRTNKRRWCVLKDQHLYIFKNQEEPAYFVIDLPGCDISTVPKGDRSKVSYSFKITQGGIAAMILGIEEEKDLSAWMNALITASVSKSPLSPPLKTNKSMPRVTSSPFEKDDVLNDGQSEARRHTFGSLSAYKAKEINIDIDISNYEQPADVLGLAVSLDSENYNPPLPPLPGELNEILEMNNDTKPKYSGIYEEVTEDFLQNISENVNKDSSAEPSKRVEMLNDLNHSDSSLKVSSDDLTNDDAPFIRLSHSEGATSDSEFSSDDEDTSDRIFHDRWAVHSGVLYQKRPIGWNRRYCKIVDNWFKGYKNPDDQSPMFDVNLSACNVRAAETEGKRKYIFQLNLAEGESLYFNTDTKDSLQRWLEVVSIATTSRRENSLALSEDELDKVGDASEDVDQSRDSMPLPIPERVESLRRSRVLVSDDVTSESEKDEESNVEKPPEIIPRIVVDQERKNSHSTNSEKELLETNEETKEGMGAEMGVETKERMGGEMGVETKEGMGAEMGVETNEGMGGETDGKDSSAKTHEVNGEAKLPEVGKELEEPSEVWEKRVLPTRQYNTTPRLRTGGKKSRRVPLRDVGDSPQQQPSPTISGLDLTSRSTPSLHQHSLHVSKRRECSEKLKKFLDKNGQFSGYILELTIKPNSTNLTRRWAAVQHGFMRIYENYGCTAPFLKISLVEAFLKDFTNTEKERYCFLLEYGAGQSILFQTNTHQELRRWIAVITLSIASHTDMFGSGRDLRQKRVTSGGGGDPAPLAKDSCCELTPSDGGVTSSTTVTSSGSVTSLGVISSSGVTSSCGETSSRETSLMSSSSGTSSNMTSSSCTSSSTTSSSDTSSSMTSTLSMTSSTNVGYCDCADDDQVTLSCTPAVLKKVLHHKSYSMMSLEQDDVSAGDTRESYTCRASLAVRHHGFLRVTRGTQPSQLGYCLLKASLFSVYENDKFENPKEVFNLLYDEYSESSSEEELSFTIRNDSDGVVKFECESKGDYDVWKAILHEVALQGAASGSNDGSPTQTGNPRTPLRITSDSAASDATSSSSSVATQRSSYRRSMAEEESKHHEALRQLDEDLATGNCECPTTEYKCHVYEVRDSSGNKTIIRRWCVVSDDVMRIYERETSREAVTELHTNSYRVKDVENARDFPFAFQLEPQLEPSNAAGSNEVNIVIQASNVTDFRELLKRLKNFPRRKVSQSKGESTVQRKLSESKSESTVQRKLSVSKSESNIQIEKKNAARKPLIHAKSDLSLKKEVKRIFSLARRPSKSDVTAATEVSPLGHDTWPKVTRRERRSARRALSDTSNERPVTYSMIEGRLGPTVSCFYGNEYTGYLTEVKNNELCRSEVRKWCVVKDQRFSAYDDKNTQSPPCTVIDLHSTQLVDMSHLYKNSFEFRVNNGVVQSHLYRAASDFHRWLMVLTAGMMSVSDCGRNVGPTPKAKKERNPSQGSTGVPHDQDTAF